jgi:hypothetical protein|tara:strand:- start:10270 stop:10611 length:342 start_codon:yes stop_codon:yes gene_type:complete
MALNQLAFLNNLLIRKYISHILTSLLYSEIAIVRSGELRTERMENTANISSQRSMEFSLKDSRRLDSLTLFIMKIMKVTGNKILNKVADSDAPGMMDAYISRGTKTMNMSMII